LTTPAEIFTAASDGTGLKQLTHQNDAALAKIEMNAPEKFWFAGAEAARVHAMLIKPPKFDATKNIRCWCCCTATTDDVGRFVGIPVECTSVFGRGIRDAVDQPARVDGLRTEIYG